MIKKCQQFGNFFEAFIYIVSLIDFKIFYFLKRLFPPSMETGKYTLNSSNTETLIEEKNVVTCYHKDSCNSYIIKVGHYAVCVIRRR